MTVQEFRAAFTKSNPSILILFLIQVCAAVERTSGQTGLDRLLSFLHHKERLISEAAELKDKIKLCRKQILELELGHDIADY